MGKEPGGGGGSYLWLLSYHVIVDVTNPLHVEGYKCDTNLEFPCVAYTDGLIIAHCKPKHSNALPLRGRVSSSEGKTSPKTC